MARQGTAQQKQSDTYLRSPQYKAAVIKTFMAQPTAQKTLLLNKASKLDPSDPTRQALESVASKLPAIPGATGLSEAAIHAQTFGITPSGVLKEVQRGAQDLYNMPLGTVEGVAGVGIQGAKGLGALSKGNVSGFLGHEATAAHMVGDPIVHFAEHPVHDSLQHPGNALMMLTGIEGAVGRLAGGAARLSASEALRSAASTARPDLQLGKVGDVASGIPEARGYSKDVFRKALQVAHERTIRARGLDPNVSRPAPRAIPPQLAYALNVGTDAKLARQADEATAVSQMESRAARSRVLKAISKEAPKGAGRDIISHILQGVIRTPETAVEDIGKEVNRLKAAQTGKRTFKQVMNKRQVKSLTEALKEPGAIDKAFTAAEKIRPTLSAQDEALVAHGLLDPEQATRAKVMPYAMAHMGVTYDHQLQKFVEPGARRAGGVRYGRTQDIPTQKILDHIEASGTPVPAFIRHSPGAAGARDFYSAYKLARGALKGHRTGELFRQGAYDHTFEGLAGQVASRAQSLSKATLHDKVVNRFGVTLPPDQMRQVLQKAGVRPMQISKAINTGRFTADEANAIAYAVLHDDHGNPIPGRLHLTPISATPATVLDHVANLQKPHELGDLSQLELRTVAHAVDDATRRVGTGDKTRNVTLIPTHVADRFAEQFRRTDAIGKSLGQVTQQFRRTVLPYSTHWMMQTASEAGIRAVLTGNASPRGMIDGWRLAKENAKTEAGQAANMEMHGATYGGIHDNLGVHNANPGLATRLVHATPVVRQIVAAHNRYANTIMPAVGQMEHAVRVMGMGKMAHAEAQAFGHSWKDAVLLSGETIKQLSERMQADPALVAKLGRQIDNTFGKYNKFTPTQRALIQSFTPFLPWYLTAARFVYMELPLHHPVATALLASTRQTLNQDLADGKKAPLPLWMAQAIARISPFGIFSPPSTDLNLAGLASGTDIVPGAVLPEATSAYNAWQGVSPFGGAPLKGPPSPGNTRGYVKAQSPAALATALEALTEAGLPLAQKARIIREGGRPSYATSTLVHPQPKPGTKGGVGAILNRTLNPFYSFDPNAGPPYGSAKAQKAAAAAYAAGKKSGGAAFGGGSSSGKAPFGSAFGGGSSSGAPFG